MTDNPADISDQTPDEPESWSEGDDLPVAQVRDLFTVLGKALRAFQLYDENNPVRRRFVTNLREAFEQLWQELEGLNLSVEEHRFLFAGEAVYENPSRSDSLAFLLYKDGVRDVTFLPGIEGHELDTILGVLQRAKMLKTAEADDLLTMLWEADLEFFKCQYVARFTDGAVIPTAQAVAERADLDQVLQGEAEASQAAKGDAGAEGDTAQDDAGAGASTATKWLTVAQDRPGFFADDLRARAGGKGGTSASVSGRDVPRFKA